jgi:DNA-binding transcriptional MerR regulator
MSKSEKKTIEIKPYMIGELAKYYQVSEKTLRCWLKGFADRLGERNGRYYTIKQVEMIFQELGTPQVIEM